MAPIQIVLKSRGVSAHSISNAMQLDEIGTRPARYWHTAHNDDVLTVLDQVIGPYANQPCQLDFLVVL